MKQKMINGMTVNRWACINFSRSVQDSVARTFCNDLAQMCQVSGMVVFYLLYCTFFFCVISAGKENLTSNNTCFFPQEFNLEPVIPIYNAKPEQVEKALKHVYHVSTNKTKGKELELLLAILPDSNGSLYGKPHEWMVITLKNSHTVSIFDLKMQNFHFIIFYFQVISSVFVKLTLV